MHETLFFAFLTPLSVNSLQLLLANQVRLSLMISLYGTPATFFVSVASSFYYPLSHISLNTKDDLGVMLWVLPPQYNNYSNNSGRLTVKEHNSEYEGYREKKH
ncbi:hypothetical protein ACTXT7_007317 [Hymenolepis weldensis]